MGGGQPDRRAVSGQRGGRPGGVGGQRQVLLAQALVALEPAGRQQHPGPGQDGHLVLGVLDSAADDHAADAVAVGDQFGDAGVQPELDAGAGGAVQQRGGQRLAVPGDPAGPVERVPGASGGAGRAQRVRPFAEGATIEGLAAQHPSSGLRARRLAMGVGGAGVHGQRQLGRGEPAGQGRRGLDEGGAAFGGGGGRRRAEDRVEVLSRLDGGVAHPRLGHQVVAGQPDPAVAQRGGATQLRTGLDHQHLVAEPAGRDGRQQPGGAAADHDQVGGHRLREGGLEVVHQPATEWARAISVRTATPVPPAGT